MLVNWCVTGGNCKEIPHGDIPVPTSPLSDILSFRYDCTSSLCKPFLHFCPSVSWLQLDSASCVHTCSGIHKIMSVHHDVMGAHVP